MPADEASNFIRDIVQADTRSGLWDGRVVTRFPPEPNGYLHIGHAKSICRNFGLAAEFRGQCHLRFDDTNPVKEEQEYIDSIMEDVRWLGFDWGGHLYHASDYFEELFDYACRLIEKGEAYVCDLTAEQIREYRGTLTTPGVNSPFRDRSVEENMDLFRRMRAGEFGNGERVLRARIDMASPNMNLRDPVLYRILHADHPRTGSAWCIYPTYDFAHGQSDSIERITHSICTLEFEDHRPLYDWLCDHIGIYHPRQIEFARLNLTFLVLSKRKLITLVREGVVQGWSDPRMPTISGIRRRGFPPAAIRTFCDRIGVSKSNSVVEMAMLEHCVREELNFTAKRGMAVLDPVRLIIENYPEGHVEEVKAENNPERPEDGERLLPFTRELFIERADVTENPPPKYFRLAPGREVRLKHAYYVTCTGVEKDPATGEITTVRCTYDPASRGGWTDDGRKVKGTLHWVSADHAREAEVRLYDSLFTHPAPGERTGDFLDDINPDSLTVLTGCRIEPSLAEAQPEERFQFLRHGYFCADALDHSSGRPVFNRTLSLRDTWARLQRKTE